MENLVFKTETGNVVTTSLLIAEKFGKEHKNVIASIREIINSAENLAQFYQLDSYKDSSGKVNLMFIMTRDGFSLLVMGFTGEKALQFKIEYIKAFNEMEKALINLSQLPDFNNPAIAARAWADQYEQRELAESKVKALEPKAAVTDMIANATNLLTWNDAAKILGTGRTRLCKLLRDKGILRGNNTPYQEYIERGYFKIKIKPITMGDMTNDYAQTFVTGKGLTWLAKGILKNQ
jgi:anti-repressor protein